MPRPRHSSFEIFPLGAVRHTYCLAIAALLASLILLGDPAAGQVLRPEEAGIRVFPVARLELVYSQPHPDQPALDGIAPISVELRETEFGWAAPVPGAATQSLEIGGPHSATVVLEASGLARTLRALVTAIHDTGLYGVDVRPSSRDIDLESEHDLRPPGRDALQIVVTVGRVKLVRTIAVGDRIRGDWKINNELHERIRADSPLQPAGSSDDDSTELLDRRELEDYLFRLNRHSGRRVEAALSPAEEPGGIVLDYRVFEARPWFVYGQVSNTGTRRTSHWQTRVGAVHRQLSDRDDILSIEYLYGGTDVNGFRAQYQAPFFSPKRPDWMNRRKGDPGWIEWFPREKIPWWGVAKLRWEAELAYGDFEAKPSSSSPPDDKVSSEQFHASGRLIYEAWQVRDFFFDVWTGLRVENFKVENKTGPSRTSGDEVFLLPRLGIHAERINAISNFNLDLNAEAQVLEASGSNSSGAERLGRQRVDDRYFLINFNLGFATYLEPILFPKGFRDPESRRSSTLAHEIAIGLRGQYAFDYRLIPQASQIIGGIYSVRGFPQSLAVGDSVIVSSLEYRFHVPRALPIMREPLKLPLLGDFRATPQQVYGRPDWDLTLRAFVDVGRSIRNANNVAGGSFEPDETLVGIGVGAELQLRSNLRARIDWATPLKSTNDNVSPTLKPGEDSEIHLLFSILY
jgi:hemolysin activation/secretion protein